MTNHLSAMMLRVLINRYHPEGADKLLQRLPDERKEETGSLVVHSEDVKGALSPARSTLAHVHYSWILEPLQQYQGELQDYFLSALTEKQTEGLKKLLRRDVQKQPLADPVLQFLQASIAKKLGFEDHLPPSFLPEHPLNHLLKISRDQLFELIDLLGINDLASEVRQIIDKEHLKQLMKFLTKRRQRFLKHILYLPDKIPHEKLGIEQFRGPREKLERVLHRRGLLLLGKAFAGCHSDLLWHFTRRVDSGRGHLLERVWNEEPEAVITPAALQQVEMAYQFLEKSR